MGVENNMPEGWSLKTLNTLCSKITDGTHSTVIDDESGHYYLLSCKNIKNGKINIGKSERKINKTTLDFLRKRTGLRKDDIVLTTVGTIGEIAMVQDEVVDFEFQRSVAIIRCNNEKILPIFMYQYAKSRFFQHQALSRCLGSVQTCLFLGEIKEIEINLPPITEQKAIAKVLTAFDDKIELLQAQNKTLETMAQTIFKEWFGKYQIGDELPEGWRVGKYSDIIKLSSGKGVKKTEYVDNGKYKIIGANGIIGRLNKFLIQEKVIVTGRVGTLGTVFILNQPCWISDNVLINQPSIDHSFYFSYFTLKSFNFSSLNIGSTQPLITQGALKSVEIIIPNSFILEEFENICVPFFEKIQINDTQIKSLTKTRDTLLPKLMSGQVRVNNLKQTADA